MEGRNVAIEYRWADNQYDRLPGLAEDLVHRRVTVITTGSATLAALAAKAATTTIPIVFLTGSDPVELGFVTSLNRPGGNLTGVTTLNVEMGPKRLEVLHELLPAATIVGALVNGAPGVTQIPVTALTLSPGSDGLALVVVFASAGLDPSQSVAILDGGQAGPAVQTTAFNLANPIDKNIPNFNAVLSLGIQFSDQEGLGHTCGQNPAFAQFSTVDVNGGSITDQYRLVGNYTGRILKGEKPADLPVQQVTKIELIINLTTTKALGVTVPTSILLRADEVIE